jgi:chromosomal replication initiator protein
VFVVGVRHDYARDMLTHRLYRIVRRVLVDVLRRPAELRFEVHRPAPAAPVVVADDDALPMFRYLAQQPQQPLSPPDTWTTARPERPLPLESVLNPRLTFERYIVGRENYIGYEAARAVCEYPATTYNPLFVHGGVGMGKTHLLQAVAHACTKRNLHAVYIPSEVFTNDLVDAIRHRNTAMFRERYRQVDVLLMDDVQFMISKETTQEEFFHTFNTMITANRQIILASDRPPSALNGLEDRLRSRFAGGLVVEIQPPTTETRIAILQQWAEERAFDLSPDMALMISQRAPNNIRELEGVWNQVLANARLAKQPITPHMTEQALAHFHSARNHLTIAQIISVTAEYYGVALDDIDSGKRAARVNEARQMAMYLARELLDLSLSQIGDAMGGRNHSTVLHGCQKVMQALQQNHRHVSNAVETIRVTLRA